jgi:hypothetical protein
MPQPTTEARAAAVLIRRPWGQPPLLDLEAMVDLR